MTGVEELPAWLATEKELADYWTRRGREAEREEDGGPAA